MQIRSQRLLLGSQALIPEATIANMRRMRAPVVRPRIGNGMISRLPNPCMISLAVVAVLTPSAFTIGANIGTHAPAEHRSWKCCPGLRLPLELHCEEAHGEQVCCASGT